MITSERSFLYGATRSGQLQKLRPGLETELNVDCGLPHPPISEWLGCTDWAISKLIRIAEELEGKRSKGLSGSSESSSLDYVTCNIYVTCV